MLPETFTMISGGAVSVLFSFSERCDGANGSAVRMTTTIATYRGFFKRHHASFLVSVLDSFAS